MIRALVALALRERVVVLGMAAALVLVGLYSFQQLDIEAYPDPVQPMVEILTLPTGLAAEEVEKLITVPTEFGLSGARELERMDSISLFGLSDIRCYFSWDSDYYWDRVETIERLGFVTLPQGVTPGISPQNSIGEIYRYTVEGPDHDLLKEKEIEDWILEKQLKTVPGVLDVTGFGGLTKEYHVDVDPQQLVHYGITLSTLISSLANSNTNAGGNTLTIGEQAFDVRSLGFIHSLDDIRSVVLQAKQSTPIRVDNVAQVEIGYAPRLGIVGKDQQNEVVTGIVLMRKYGDTLKTLKGVEKKVAELNTSGILPPGYKVTPYYDRTKLVEITLRTVQENLAIGIVLVFLVLLFFLGNFKTALIAAVNIPLALFGAFTLMYAGSTPANLISLGAIDFGIIIDSTVIVIENISRHLTAIEITNEAVRPRIVRAVEEVSGPIFFATVIFLIAFLPLFTMRGVEGALFSPMSHTYAYALGTGILLAIALSPVLSSYMFVGGLHETHNVVWVLIRRFYHSLFVRVLTWPRATLAAIGVLIVAVLSLFPSLGGQFLPKLEEGNIWVIGTMPLTISLEHGAVLSARMRRAFLSFPEVKTVVSQMGRPDNGTETTGFFGIEFDVELKPSDEWPQGMTKDALIAQMDEKVRRDVPGVGVDFQQNIEANVNEALSGVKGTNSVKVFGPDLDSDESLANRIKDVMDHVAGVVDTEVYRSLGQPNLVIVPNRQACSRYGLGVGDVAAVVQAAIGGQAVTQVLEGDRRFDLVVRFQPRTVRASTRSEISA